MTDCGLADIYTHHYIITQGWRVERFSVPFFLYPCGRGGFNFESGSSVGSHLFLFCSVLFCSPPVEVPSLTIADPDSLWKYEKEKLIREN